MDGKRYTTEELIKVLEKNRDNNNDDGEMESGTQDAIIARLLTADILASLYTDGAKNVAQKLLFAKALVEAGSDIVCSALEMGHIYSITPELYLALEKAVSEYCDLDRDEWVAERHAIFERVNDNKGE